MKYEKLSVYLQYLHVHIDAHEAIMSTYKTQNKLDSIRSWLEKKEQHGALQALQMKYDTSYYDALCKNENFYNTFQNETKDAMVREKRKRIKEAFFHR